MTRGQARHRSTNQDHFGKPADPLQSRHRQSKPSPGTSLLAPAEGRPTCPPTRRAARPLDTTDIATTLSTRPRLASAECSPRHTPASTKVEADERLVVAYPGFCSRPPASSSSTRQLRFPVGDEPASTSPWVCSVPKVLFCERLKHTQKALSRRASRPLQVSRASPPDPRRSGASAPAPPASRAAAASPWPVGREGSCEPGLEVCLLPRSADYPRA